MDLGHAHSCKVLISPARCSSFKVSTLQKNEHLAAVNRARAPIEPVPADDLDIPDFLRRTAEHRAPGPPGASLNDLEAL
jgi:hypothetical protein